MPFLSYGGTNGFRGSHLPSDAKLVSNRVWIQPCVLITQLRSLQRV